MSLDDNPVRFSLFHPYALTPTRNNPDDAGVDIFAIDDVTVRPGQVAAIPTGVHVALEEGETALFWDKSGRASNGLTVLGGCIDGPYRGELKVVAANVNIWPVLWAFRNPFLAWWRVPRAIAECTVKIPYGKALTQVLVADLKIRPVELMSKEAYLALPKTTRGTDGFGSSDRKDHLACTS